MATNKYLNGYKIVTLALALLVQSAVISAEDNFDVFATHNDENEQFVGYDELGTFLRSFGVERSHRLNMYYSAMRPEGVEFLKAYGEALADISPSSLSRQEQLAYWLNLRNVLVIQAIAAEPPGRSLKGERGTVAEPGEMWTRKRLTIEGVSLSIDDIEKNVILRNFDNPNIIYGLYQGAKGGPALWRKGFSGATIEADLKSLGENYVNERSVIRIRSNKARVPLVYHWYKDTLFNGEDAKIIEHLSGLAKPELRDKLEEIASLSERKFSYALDVHEVRQVGFSNVPSGSSPIGSGS